MSVFCQAYTADEDTTYTLVYTSVGDIKSEYGTLSFQDDATEGYESFSDVPWYSIRNKITRCIIHDEIYPNSLSALFSILGNVTEIENIENLNTMNATSANQMCYGSTKLISIDCSHFITSNITNMNGMFSNCTRLSYVNMSGWDTSNVTTMSQMFMSSKGFTEIDVSSFDTHKVTNMSNMFRVGSNLTTIYASENFNTDLVTTSTNMFASCTNLVGGAGTVFDASRVDKAYARLDSDILPGYFSVRNDGLPVIVNGTRLANMVFNGVEIKTLYYNDIKIFPVVKVPITIRTGGQYKIYDGLPLTCGDTYIDYDGGDPEIEAELNFVLVIATGSQTEIGSSLNTCEIEWNGINPNKYKVSIELGTLTVGAPPTPTPPENPGL